MMYIGCDIVEVMTTQGVYWLCYSRGHDHALCILVVIAEVMTTQDAYWLLYYYGRGHDHAGCILVVI